MSSESRVQRRAGAPIWRGLALPAILALSLGLRLYDLTGESLWYDEAYSVWTSGMAIGSLRTLWEWQIEFPLYYLLLHGWMILFGDGEFAVRLYGALAGAATVVPLYYLGARLFGHRAGVAAALLLAVNPYHVWYSQEVRMFPWAILFSVLSLYAFSRLLDGAHTGWWVTHALATGLSFHLHYYILWLILAQNVYLLGWLAWRYRTVLGRDARPLLWRWLLDQAIVGALALPALAVYLTKAVEFNQWGWLGERYGAPGVREVAGLFLAFVVGLGFPGPSALGWLITLTMVGLAALAVASRLGVGRGVSTAPLWLAVVALGVPLLSALVAGQFRPLWVPRHLSLFLPFFLLLVGLGATSLPGPLSSALAVMLVVADLYALSGIYGVPQKEDWRGVAAYLAAQRAPGDGVVLMDAECRVPYEYYAERPADVEISRFADADALDRAAAEIAATPRGQRVWVVVSHADGQGLIERLAQTPQLERVDAPSFVGIELAGYRWR